MQDSQIAINGPRLASGPLVAFHSLPVRRRSAFTLTELLIVIAIIAVLAGLIAAAAINALRKGRETRVSLEIKNMSTAIENFKNDYGAYPPNGMNPSSGAFGAMVKADFVRMFSKAFPRQAESPDLIAAIAGVAPSSSNVVTNGPLPQGMTSAEALYFWFGGFSSDEQYPISGPGGPSYLVSEGEVLENRNRRYEFDLGRLVPRNDNKEFYVDSSDPLAGRQLLYKDPKTGDPRAINFWRYTPQGSEQPFIYFDTSRHKPYQYDVPAVTSTGDVYALKKFREGKTATSSPAPTLRDVVFVDNKYQVLHCGLDDDWGNFGGSASASGASLNSLLLFPEGPFIGPAADTLTNFTDGTLESASEE